MIWVFRLSKYRTWVNNVTVQGPRRVTVILSPRVIWIICEEFYHMLTEIIITMAVLAAIGGYIITSVLLLKFPLLLHKKKQIKFNPVHISHRGGMYCTSYFSDSSIQALCSMWLIRINEGSWKYKMKVNMSE